MIRVGLLVESGREGLEAIVCRRILQLIAAEHELDLQVVILPMNNKKQLLEDCGTATKNLLADDCDRVVILWDERPAWPKMDEELCWHNDREQVLAELKKAKVPANRAHLVCIEREFESWLLFDHKMLECVLSTPEHPVTVPKQKNPDTQKNPKSLMTTLFRKLAGKTYVDVEYAKRLAACLESLSRLRKCATFRRFEARVIG